MKHKWNKKSYSSNSSDSLNIKCPRCGKLGVEYGKCLWKDCNYGRTREDMDEMYKQLGHF